MARDFVTVANLATGFFGEDDQIRSPDENSKPARTIRAVWDEGRKLVLSRGNWGFAKRRFPLTARPTTTKRPIIGYQSAFPLPPDFRRLVQILEPCEIRERYAIEGGEILADTSGPVVILYIVDVEDPALWSDGFVNAFSMWLAWRCCDRLSGDKARKSDAFNAYRLALREGRGDDTKQEPPQDLVEGEWIRARGAGSAVDPTRY